MIQINLLPGSGKKARKSGGGGGGPSFNFGAFFATVGARITDPFLIGGVATATLCVLAVGGLWSMQTAQAREITEKEQRAVQDSTKFAAVLAERQAAELQRDSALRQLNIIKSIDNNRFVWAHVMDELSRALPAYTWLTSIVQTSTPPAAQPAGPAKADDKTKAPEKLEDKFKDASKQSAASEAAAQPSMKFHLVGHTVDIQALTRFMKDLESSPFVQNVQLAKTTIVVHDGKELTEFQLDAEYQTPEPGVIRTVPVSLSVR